MRYPVAVIALAVVFAATAYVSFAFDSNSTATNSVSQNQVILTGFEYTDNLARTCSGAKPRFGAQPYFFGFSGQGICMTQVMYANTSDEALECAKAMCPDCGIEDITSWYQYSTSAPDAALKEGYCPGK